MRCKHIITILKNSQGSNGISLIGHVDTLCILPSDTYVIYYIEDI